MILKRIGILSCGKVLGVLYAAMGLIFGGFMSLLSLAGAFAAHQARDGDPLAPLIFGAGAVIILPIFYGICGFVGGVIMAAVYNLVAAVVGGIELEFSSQAT